MGGFEGGDEAGFWDIEELPCPLDKEDGHNSNASQTIAPSIEITASEYRINAHARISLFTKVTEIKEDSLLLFSRYMQVKELYDTIRFVPSQSESFEIEGCEDIPLMSNSIFCAYEALLEYTDDSDIEAFFDTHKVVVSKRIPSHAGLGGSASDAAAFLHLAKVACNLILTTNELVEIGRTVSPDIAFFIYNYPAANVTSGAEVRIEPFEDTSLDLQLLTSDILYDADLLCQSYQKQLPANTDPTLAYKWKSLDAKSLLQSVPDPFELNDLYAPLLLAYPDLKEDVRDGWYLCACGPTLFKVL